MSYLNPSLYVQLTPDCIAMAIKALRAMCFRSFCLNEASYPPEESYFQAFTDQNGYVPPFFFFSHFLVLPPFPR